MSYQRSEPASWAAAVADFLTIAEQDEVLDSVISAFDDTGAPAETVDDYIAGLKAEARETAKEIPELDRKRLEALLDQVAPELRRREQKADAHFEMLKALVEKMDPAVKQAVSPDVDFNNYIMRLHRILAGLRNELILAIPREKRRASDNRLRINWAADGDGQMRWSFEGVTEWRSLRQLLTKCARVYGQLNEGRSAATGDYLLQCIHNRILLVPGFAFNTQTGPDFFVLDWKAPQVEGQIPVGDAPRAALREAEMQRQSPAESEQMDLLRWLVEIAGQNPAVNTAMWNVIERFMGNKVEPQNRHQLREYMAQTLARRSATELAPLRDAFGLDPTQQPKSQAISIDMAPVEDPSLPQDPVQARSERTKTQA